MKESYLYEPTNSRLVTAGNRTMKQTGNYNKNNNLQNYYSSQPNQRARTQYPGDSLQLFQSQLDSMVAKKKQNFRSHKPKKIVTTSTNIPSKQTLQLKQQISQIRGILSSERQNQKSGFQQKLDKLLVELQLQKTHKNQNLLQSPQNMTQSPSQSSNYPVQVIPTAHSPYLFPQQQNPYQQQPPQQSSYPFYYPFPMPFPQHQPPRSHYRSRRRHRNDRYSSSDSEPSSESEDERKKKKKEKKSLPPLKKQDKKYQPRRQKLVKKLRRIFFVVAFTVFIRSETKKLSAHRKSSLKKFWLEKFNPQINNIKNWLLDAHKYSLSIILQKCLLPLRLNDEPENGNNKNGQNRIMYGNQTQKSYNTSKSLRSQRVKSQKEKLIMQIIHIGITKLLEDCTPQKVSMFAEGIVHLCRKNSFVVGRFWSAYQMEQLCISEYFGFLRLDQNLEKYLIGLLLFIKMLIYNMFLQPHKFDAENFPKQKQPLQDNMLFISSILYALVKEVIEQYKAKERDPNVYKVGNWLKIPKQFIVQCSEPFIYGRVVPQEQYITGLVSPHQFSELRQNHHWSLCCEKIKLIIEKVHKQMFNKAKLMRKNLKYKVYN